MRYQMRVVGTGVVLAVVSVAAVACGSDAATTSTDGQTGFAAYTACLAQNGVTLASTGPGMGGRTPGAMPSDGPGAMPSDRPSAFPEGTAPPGGPGPGGFGGGMGGALGSQAPDGVDQETWTKAQEACASVRPTGGPGQRGDDSAMAAYRNCLSENGVTASTPPNQLNSADPIVAKAMQACEPLRPTAAPPSSSS